MYLLQVLLQVQWMAEHTNFKVPVVNRLDYTMYIEQFAGRLWFHTDVYKWSSEIKTKYLEDLNLLQYLVKIPLVALVEEDNTKLAKFGKLTGWNVMDQIKLDNGKVGYVYTRSI
jgi:hypothetical protein